MRFTLAQEHIDHFNKTGAIEFDGVFSEKECLSLKEKAEEILALRLNPTDRNPLDYMSNECLYLNGRNLWKEGLELKKLCSKKQIGEIAYYLFRKKPIKIGFDQYIRTGILQDCPFKEDHTLKEISSVRPLLGALLILLEPLSSEIDSPFLPKKAGNAMYVSGNVIMPLISLFNEKKASMLLVSFTFGKALYCLEPKDPLTHSLKKEGVVFGDVAAEDLCPTIYHP